MSDTRITDEDYADAALYDKVNAIADEIDAETVHLDDEQTITGAKTFQNNLVSQSLTADTSTLCNVLYQKIVSGTAEVFGKYLQRTTDALKRIVRVTNSSIGGEGANYCDLSFTVENSGLSYLEYAPNGSTNVDIPAGDSSNKIPSTKWVKNEITSGTGDLSNKYVTLDTGQTIEGSKTFKNSKLVQSSSENSTFDMILEGTSGTSNPTGKRSTAVRFVTEDGLVLGSFTNNYNPQGRSNIQFYAQTYDESGNPKTAQIGVGVGRDGSYSSSAPEAPADSNGNYIATTKWVRDRLSPVEASVATKIDEATVNSKLSAYLTQGEATTYVNQLNASLASKANVADVYTKTETYSAEEIDQKTSSVYKFKGSVETQAKLPAGEQNTTGDVWNVQKTDSGEDWGMNFAWDGTSWDALGGKLDTSELAKKADTLAGYGITDAYTRDQVNNAISTAIAGKADTATVNSQISTLQTALDGTVKTTGDQTVAGTKTFTGGVRLPTSNGSNAKDGINIEYANEKLLANKGANLSVTSTYSKLTGVTGVYVVKTEAEAKTYSAANPTVLVIVTDAS